MGRWLSGAKRCSAEILFTLETQAFHKALKIEVPFRVTQYVSGLLYNFSLWEQIFLIYSLFLFYMNANFMWHSCFWHELSADSYCMLVVFQCVQVFDRFWENCFFFSFVSRSRNNLQKDPKLDTFMPIDEFKGTVCVSTECIHRLWIYVYHIVQYMFHLYMLWFHVTAILARSFL